MSTAAATASTMKPVLYPLDWMMPVNTGDHTNVPTPVNAEAMPRNLPACFGANQLLMSADGPTRKMTGPARPNRAPEM